MEWETENWQFIPSQRQKLKTRWVGRLSRHHSQRVVVVPASRQKKNVNLPDRSSTSRKTLAQALGRKWIHFGRELKLILTKTTTVKKCAPCDHWLRSGKLSNTMLANSLGHTLPSKRFKTAAVKTKTCWLRKPWSITKQRRKQRTKIQKYSLSYMFGIS